MVTAPVLDVPRRSHCLQLVQKPSRNHFCLFSAEHSSWLSLVRISRHAQQDRCLILRNIFVASSAAFYCPTSPVKLVSWPTVVQHRPEPSARAYVKSKRIYLASCHMIFPRTLMMRCISATYIKPAPRCRLLTLSTTCTRHDSAGAKSQ